ncbi:enoyl-CoA delta isomerase 2 [Aphelenchoides avenae]|nr:enoyl-CoA delta isomerase 2 [Aphelenchus avenae]
MLGRLYQARVRASIRVIADNCRLANKLSANCNRRNYSAKAAVQVDEQPAILTKKEDKIFRITFNCPARLNAISTDMYQQLSDGLEQAQADPGVVYTVFTGNGDFYSSGNNFSPAVLKKIMQKPEYIEQIWDGAQRFIEALIMHDKALIGLVNGPAIGVACSTLSLFDQVIASDKAYFHCPFTQVGICAEGTSSASFPALMGHQRAAQMTMFAEQLSARQAQDAGLVTRVFPDASFKEEAEKLLAKYQQLAPKSVLETKKLLRPDALKHKLLDVNKREFESLRQLWLSGETMDFMSRRFLSNKA